jgi:hypothetical protein
MHKYEVFVKKKKFERAKIGGGTIFPRSLKSTGNKRNFKLGHLKKSLMNPLYLLKIVFSKFDPFTATGMSLCVDLGPKCQN